MDNLLLTGYPGCGKTTVVCRVAELVSDLQPVGFYTQEMRDGGTRVGFTLTTFDGAECVMAQKGLKSKHRVGKYGVDVGAVDRVAADVRSKLTSSPGLVIIDEIGKMECFSKEFRSLVLEVLDSRAVLLATVAARGNKFIEYVKSLPKVRVIEVSTRNRDDLPQKLAAEIPAGVKTELRR